MPDNNAYIKDWTEIAPSDDEQQPTCECCGEWPCAMNRWEDEERA